MKNGALYTLISRLKFNDKERYEIEIFNNNLISDNTEVKKIMNFYLKILFLLNKNIYIFVKDIYIIFVLKYNI